MKTSTIEQAMHHIRNGKMLIVVDDEDRENEGDLVMAAELATPDAINFMAKEGRGLICVSLPEERARQLSLEPMQQKNTSLHATAFTTSVDARQNTTTGISAFDRYETIRTLIDAHTQPEDLARPGHIFPIVAKDGGVLRRAGHTEASVDLARLAGLRPAGVMCEILAEDGTMARRKQLADFAKVHGLPIITIADLIRYRRKKELLVRHLETVHLPTAYGDFDLHLYEDIYGGQDHLALTLGEIRPDETTLVRIHSECLTGDVFGSERCDCGDQLGYAMRKVSKAGKGIIVYLRQEGRGIGLKHKIKAYALQEQGFDTVEANQQLGFPPDMRDYGVGAHILADLGAGKLAVMTNNPMKMVAIKAYGLSIEERVPIVATPKPANEKYLATKREKLGHLLDE